jgi:hypothetical protein
VESLNFSHFIFERLAEMDATLWQNQFFNFTVSGTQAVGDGNAAILSFSSDSNKLFELKAGCSTDGAAASAESLTCSNWKTSNILSISPKSVQMVGDSYEFKLDVQGAFWSSLTDLQVTKLKAKAESSSTKSKKNDFSITSVVEAKTNTLTSVDSSAVLSLDTTVTLTVPKSFFADKKKTILKAQSRAPIVGHVIRFKEGSAIVNCSKGKDQACVQEIVHVTVLPVGGFAALRSILENNWEPEIQTNLLFTVKAVDSYHTRATGVIKNLIGLPMRNDDRDIAFTKHVICPSDVVTMLTNGGFPTREVTLAELVRAFNDKCFWVRTDVDVQFRTLPQRKYAIRCMTKCPCGDSTNEKSVPKPEGGDAAKPEGGDAAKPEGGDAAKPEGGDAAKSEGGDAAKSEGGDAEKSEGGDAAKSEGGDAAKSEGDTSKPAGNGSNSGFTVHELGKALPPVSK